MSTPNQNHFLRGPLKGKPAPILPLDKLQARRRAHRDNQTNYSIRQKHLGDPPVHRISAALLAAFVTRPLSEADQLKPITEATLSKLIAAGYSPDRIRTRLKKLRRRLLKAG